MDDVARNNIKKSPCLSPFENSHSSHPSKQNQEADMGPRNSAASSPLRDLSWIDRMYIKFETMCVEVDKNPSLLLQETSKYVENQVNAVGVNVKKLCTELIQDLISTPMLSSEGGEKKLECALHCKCHCMDSDRPKLINTDAAGFDNGDDDVNDVVYEKQDTMKKEGSKVETPNIMKKEVSKVDMLSRDVIGEPQNPRGSELCGPEFKEIHGQDGTNNELKLTTAIGQFETENVGGHKVRELGPAKGIKNCVVHQGDLEGNCKSNDAQENNLTSEGSVKGIMETVVCKNAAVFAEQISRLKSNDDKELLGANESSGTHINGATGSFLGSEEDKWQPQMLEFLQEMQARSVDGLCKRPVSNDDFQNVLYGEIESHLNVDASYEKCKYDSDSSAEDLQAEEMKDAVRVDGSFHFTYTYDVKDDEPITMSEFFSKEDVHDEEQSAHWFVSEDLRKVIQPDIFSVERSRYGEGHVNEFDLDWELL